MTSSSPSSASSSSSSSSSPPLVQPSKGERLWLVAHDFSPYADAAADLAVDDLIDSRTGGRIVVMHTYMVLIPGASIEGVALAPAFSQLERVALAESTRTLERIAARMRERAKDAGHIQIEILARMGPAAEAVLEEASRLGATRIIVGTHGRTGMKQLLLGSVAERIARLAHVPVIVAHDAGAKVHL